MPKSKRIYGKLPKLLIRDTIDKLLFGYVMGFRNRNSLQVLEIREGCEQFLKDMELEEDDYSLENAMQTFYRMHLTFNEFQKYNRHDQSN